MADIEMLPSSVTFVDNRVSINKFKLSSHKSDFSIISKNLFTLMIDCLDIMLIKFANSRLTFYTEK